MVEGQPMNPALLGIHHVTALAADPQTNVDFYAGVLGMRLVKLTVNFDVNEVYHLYYGDGAAQPGTILTFFPYPGAPRGRRGAGQVAATALSVPRGSLVFWSAHLAAHGVATEPVATILGEEVLAFQDPDGMALELVAVADPRPGWAAGPVPLDYAIRGFHGATLWLRDPALSAAMLTELGFREGGREGARARFVVGAGGPGQQVDLLAVPDAPNGAEAAGIVHHVAWRAADDAAQAAWRQRVLAMGRQVTPVRDRQYFRSIYFHEPGGVLYEIATDGPGFATDEALDQLGTGLKLPPWLESRRAELARALPPLRLPTGPEVR